MTIESPGTIDFVATKADDPFVRLVIADHLDWMNEEAHFLALQNKLNAYLEFVESGQLTRQFPETVGKEVQIDLVLMHPPERITQESFLLEVQNRLVKFRAKFTWRVQRSPA